MIRWFSLGTRATAIRCCRPCTICQHFGRHAWRTDEQFWQGKRKQWWKQCEVRVLLMYLYIFQSSFPRPFPSAPRSIKSQWLAWTCLHSDDARSRTRWRRTEGGGSGVRGGSGGPKTEHSLLNELCILFEQIAFNKRKSGSIRPRRFYDRLRKENQLFNSSEQQDAQEFLVSVELRFCLIYHLKGGFSKVCPIYHLKGGWVLLLLLRVFWCIILIPF